VVNEPSMDPSFTCRWTAFQIFATMQRARSGIQ